MSSVITISGQHGSGRKELGEMIASSLGVPFYGDNLAAMIAEEGKVDLSLVEAMDQVEPDTEEASVLHVAQNRTSLTKTIYQAQESVIRRLAGEGPCVILERCSETILPDAVNIFVYGDLEYRIGRIIYQQFLYFRENRRNFIHTIFTCFRFGSLRLKSRAQM